jgi:prepilin-type N-terminal cleavage/methylation domain-containing protein
VFDRRQFGKSPSETVLSAGFSLLEMLISMAILLLVTGVVMSGMLQASKAEGTIENRTEMHASVRSATELMQQEIGQSGRIGLPGSVTLGSAVTAGSASPAVGATAVAQMFVGEFLVIDTGSNQETVTVTAVGATTFTANFNLSHASTAPVTALGGFGTGVVPESVSPYSMTNGSDGSHLKLYGDINGDGNMLYIEYVCDTSGGNLYRSVTTLGSATIVAKQVLLPNIQPNPANAACFTYQERPVGCTGSACFVVDVAVTLTVQTQQEDATTATYQKETKALLNVSPRNVYDAYQLSTLSNNRVQPIPSFVTSLLSQTP